jgi:hypothetical protein
MRKPDHLRLVLLLSAALLAAACKKEVDVTDPKIAAAIGEINAVFRKGYQEALVEVGTRHFAVEPAVASSTMRRVLEELGMNVINSESDYYLHVTAPAPRPLTDKDWEEVKRIDEPAFKKIASKHIGVKGMFAELEPDGLNVVGIITIIGIRGGVDISITMRTEEIKPQPPESILPRREYPPPSAVLIGFEKIWQKFQDRIAPVPSTTAQRG